jgi:hypothetical protein
LAQAHILREVHASVQQQLQALARRDKDALERVINANKATSTTSPPDVLMFALEALVPTLCALASSSPSLSSAQVGTIFERVSVAVASRVNSLSLTSLPSFTNELNTILEPLLTLFTSVTDSALHATLSEILFGLGKKCTQPRLSSI